MRQTGPYSSSSQDTITIRIYDLEYIAHLIKLYKDCYFNQIPTSSGFETFGNIKTAGLRNFKRVAVDL